MKSLLECFEEQKDNIITITELYQFENEFLGQRIDEGLWAWLKKLWKNIFGSADKNLKVNDGEYVISNKLVKDIKDGLLSRDLITVADMPESNFLKFIKKTKSENRDGQFYDAYEFYQKSTKHDKSLLNKAKEKLGAKSGLLTKPYVLLISTKKNKEDKEASLVVGFYFLKIEKGKDGLIASPLKCILGKSIKSASDDFIDEVNRKTSELLKNNRKNVKFVKEPMNDSENETNNNEKENEKKATREPSESLIKYIKDEPEKVGIILDYSNETNLEKWCQGKEPEKYYSKILESYKNRISDKEKGKFSLYDIHAAEGEGERKFVIVGQLGLNEGTKKEPKAEIERIDFIYELINDKPDSFKKELLDKIVEALKSESTDLKDIAYSENIKKRFGIKDETKE